MELIYKILGVATAAAETVDPNAAMQAGEELPAGAGIISLIGSMFPLIIMFVLMYFLMIRPEKKRKKKEQEMLAALKRGDRICTIGGIYGTIVRIKDQVLTIEVGEQKTQMMIARWAVRNVEQLSVTNDAEQLI